MILDIKLVHDSPHADVSYSLQSLIGGMAGNPIGFGVHRKRSVIICLFRTQWVTCLTALAFCPVVIVSLKPIGHQKSTIHHIPKLPGGHVTFRPVLVLSDWLIFCP